jgi:hypothetical protein
MQTEEQITPHLGLSRCDRHHLNWLVKNRDYTHLPLGGDLSANAC